MIKEYLHIHPIGVSSKNPRVYSSYMIAQGACGSPCFRFNNSGGINIKIRGRGINLYNRIIIISVSFKSFNIHLSHRMSIFGSIYHLLPRYKSDNCLFFRSSHKYTKRHIPKKVKIRLTRGITYDGFSRIYIIRTILFG